MNEPDRRATSCTPMCCESDNGDNTDPAIPGKCPWGTPGVIDFAASLL
ncbi:hypothetical protein [Advenella mimigardefordensis]|nr:hypothetical protein [Advenella mimigardefordensis]